MSLGVVIKGPEGLVLATESRLTLTRTETRFHPPGITTRLHVNYDHATKLFSLEEPHRYVGIVTYGLGAIGLRSIFSFIPEFERDLLSERLSIQEYAQRLSEFYHAQWKRTIPDGQDAAPITFVVAGFNEDEAYGRVYAFDIPSRPKPQELNRGTPDEPEFGITWGGQKEFVDRLLQGYDQRMLQIISEHLQLNQKAIDDIRARLEPLAMQLPLGIMPLQDCVDTALLILRTTIDAQKLTADIRGCGGPIDIATITRTEGFRFVQQKQIHGE